MATTPKNLRQFSALTDIMAQLRTNPGGCPWDLEQNHKTLVPFAIEETYELAEAIEKNDIPNMREELGDLLFQVVFHAQIAAENEHFVIEDVFEELAEKLIRRHPHVFGETQANTSEEVLKNWEAIKSQEKTSTEPPTYSAAPDFKGFRVPLDLPALQRSSKIGEKTRKQNFDWNNATEVIPKVKEELAELEKALKENKPSEIEHEIGDLLFSVAQVARHAGIDPEQALRIANRRFEKRFLRLLDLASQRKALVNNLTIPQMEELWRQVKILLKYDSI